VAIFHFTNKKTMQKKYFLLAGTLALALLIAKTTYAADNQGDNSQIDNRQGQIKQGGPGQMGSSQGQGGEQGQGGDQKQGNQNKNGNEMISGKVTEVDDDTITITGKKGFGGKEETASTTYTIDASNAKVSNMTNSANNKTTVSSNSVSDIAIGDRIIVEGKVSGTTITATSIIIGVQINGNNTGDQHNGKNASSSPRGDFKNFNYSGEITAIDDETISLSTKNSGKDNNSDTTSYSVDTSNAKITSGQGDSQETLSVSDLSVGDTIGVTGTASDNTITATAITKIEKSSSSSQETKNNGNDKSDRNGDRRHASSSQGNETNGFFQNIFSHFKNFFKKIF
jgi:hypothetical protein